MKEAENNKFDISRRDEVSFKHYQILVKLFGDGQTEHHNLEIFTTGPEQLIEMRRIYSNTYKKTSNRTIYNIMKNN